MRSITFSLLVVHASLLGTSLALHKTRQTDQFDWASITPSPDLQYHDCFGTFKCARLQVPLDWTQCRSASNSTNNAAIAIVTLPATVPEDDPSFGGTVLINPGGPGDSGTEFNIAYGAYLQAVLDGERHYEVLGFDPRGVGLTTPHADCYQNDFARGSDALQRGWMPAALSGTQGLELFYEASKAVSDLCAEAGPDSILGYMSTASVARDMLEIVDHVDELRRSASNVTSNEASLPLLQYLGFSYGTFLGNTFASMFPGRVGRMALDGIVDADDYIQNGMTKTLMDAEKVVEHFYQTCFDAGTDCALRDQSDSSVDDIKRRVDDLIQHLDDTPTAITYQGRIRLITSHTIRDVIRRMLYQPIVLYEPTSLILAEAVAGNYTQLLETQTGLMTAVEQADVCVDGGASYPPSAYSYYAEAGNAVFCGDTYQNLQPFDLSWAEGAARHFEEQSPTVGEAWSHTALVCSGWSIDPKFVFRGPFGNAGPSPGSQNGTSPSAPTLILATRYDHATPLDSAYKLAEQHGGSSVVVQESYGHCALLVSPSECTRKIVSEYFATGVVPESDTTCEEDCSPGIPFQPCPGFAE